MAIGLNSFEVLHLGTYFPELLANYVKVANTLEADTNFTKHLQKEAADPQESDDASTRLTLLANQQQVWVIFFGTHLQTVSVHAHLREFGCDGMRTCKCESAKAK